ncbi:MAG: hypothetical protein JWM04_2479, partial [Verrucomicrobiales bacterium]|nr:hypothetical protein [Verrucomicrobiales bacterium]
LDCECRSGECNAMARMNKKKYRAAYENLGPASPLWIVCTEFKQILFGRAERSLDYRLRFDCAPAAFRELGEGTVNKALKNLAEFYYQELSEEDTRPPSILGSFSDNMELPIHLHYSSGNQTVAGIIRTAPYRDYEITADGVLAPLTTGIDPSSPAERSMLRRALQYWAKLRSE